MLRHHASSMGGEEEVGSIPGRGTKIPHALWHSQKNRRIKHSKIKNAHSRVLGFQDIRVKTDSMSVITLGEGFSWSFTKRTCGNNVKKGKPRIDFICKIHRKIGCEVRTQSVSRVTLSKQTTPGLCFFVSKMESSGHSCHTHVCVMLIRSEHRQKSSL